MLAADLANVIALWRTTEGLMLHVESDNETSLSRFLERNPGLSFIAESKGQIVGSVLCGHDGRHGFLHHLSVALQFRRTGYASDLLTAALKSLSVQGITRCHAFTKPENQAAAKFWASTTADQRTDLCVVTMALEASHRYPDPRQLKVFSYA